MDSTEATLESSRFWIQKVLTPTMVFIGVAGNIVTVMVLTRRRMRSSTNIYLSALAIADIIHLLFVFLLSFKHYANIHDRKYELYWRFYGITHWLCDAASSTSVWLTVSFTLERYIAVCHPIKGKVLCTENRAKSIIAIVYIFCLLTTASTTFEYQLTLNETCIEECPIRLHQSESQIVTNSKEKPRQIKLFAAQLQNEQMRTLANDLENSTCCLKNFTISTESTSLGENETYNTFMHWYSAIVFGLLPFFLIATFNCFLVAAVYQSQKRRRQMTNSQENICISNENRITLMLIGVVILFLMCQTPTASFLIYKYYNASPSKKTRTIELILGNVFNFLIVINSFCNFLLYCVMSKKFRSTFKQLFFERSKNKRQDTILLTTTTKSRNSRFNPYHPGIRRNASEYHTPRNLETQSLTSVPRSKSLMVRQVGKAKSTDLIV